MLIIGVTGKGGSGKSLVCTEFAKYGVYHIDTDKITHSIYQTNQALQSELCANFSSDIINNGNVDRKKLGEIVFNDKEKLMLLNRVVHPFVLKAIELEIAKAEKVGFAAVSVDSPVLFESGFDKKCDIVVAVVSDTKFMINRIVLRDNITEEAAKKRIECQNPDIFYTKNADYVLNNTDDTDDLKEKVLLLAAKLL